MPGTDYSDRRQTLLAAFEFRKIDAALITAAVNIQYLTGFTGSNGALLLTAKECTLFTDPRYGVQAREQTGLPIVVGKTQLFPLAAARLRRGKIRHVGFENGRVSYSQFRVLEKQLTGVATLVGLDDQLEEQRMIKSKAEIDSIRDSVRINSQAYEKAMSRWKPRMSESDLAAEIEYQMRRLGAEKPSFETIVASGPRSALPHAQPTERLLDGNQLLLVDMGAYKDGYASDMTRMAHIGKPSGKTKKLYQAVLEAQLAALASVKPGASAQAVDRSARETLRRHGMEKAFVHSTGHGLGLEIHEAPRLGKKGKTRLIAGMVITIEPGAYYEGLGGVRIEDTVLVTETGQEVLTPTPKELRVL